MDKNIIKPPTTATTLALLDKELVRIGIKGRARELLKGIARLSEGQESFKASHAELAEELWPEKSKDSGNKNVREGLKTLDDWQKQTGIRFFNRLAGTKVIEPSGAVHFNKSVYTLQLLLPLSKALSSDDPQELSTAVHEISQVTVECRDLKRTSKRARATPTKWLETGVTFLARAYEDFASEGVENPLEIIVTRSQEKLGKVDHEHSQTRRIQDFIESFESNFANPNNIESEHWSGPVGWGESEHRITIDREIETESIWGETKDE